jgi:hypothetical protein
VTTACRSDGVRISRPAVRARWLEPFAPLVLLLGLLLLTSCSSVALARPEVSGSGLLPAEPTFARAFIAAYARGDLAAADHVASLLYRAEWKRRGVTLQDQYALLPSSFQAPDHPAEWLRFTYVGGVVNSGGFGHLLYAADAMGGDGAACPTVWRVDTDPEGRVIWSEMVYLFEETVPSMRPIEPGQAADAVPMPAALASLNPRLLLGVRTGRGQEGYYAVGLYRTDEDVSSDRPARVVFFAIDEGGNARPGAWTFGQPRPGLVEYGHSPTAVTINLPSDQERLREAYLSSLLSCSRAFLIVGDR